MNGHEILKPHLLREGDKVVIGDFTLKFHLMGETGPAPLDPDVVKVFNAYFNIHRA